MSALLVRVTGRFEQDLQKQIRKFALTDTVRHLHSKTTNVACSQRLRHWVKSASRNQIEEYGDELKVHLHIFGAGNRT